MKYIISIIMQHCICIERGVVMQVIIPYMLEIKYTDLT